MTVGAAAGCGSATSGQDCCRSGGMRLTSRDGGLAGVGCAGRRFGGLQNGASAGCGVGSGATTTGAGSDFFGVGSGFLTLFESSAWERISRRLESDESSLAVFDFGPDLAPLSSRTRRCPSEERISRVVKHRLERFASRCPAGEARTLGADRSTRCDCWDDIGTLPQMHAARQKKNVSYRHTPRRLQDVILHRA